MAVTVRDLHPEEHSAALSLLARAFLDEPYIALMHGADPEARLAGLRARYAAEDPGRHTLSLGAYVGSTLVASLLGSRPGRCLGCERDEDSDPWSSAVAAVHAAHPPHAHAGRLGVDPEHRGIGAAAALLDTVVVRGRSLGAATLLECQAHRIAYYERRGFTVVARILDPPGDDGAVLVRG